MKKLYICLLSVSLLQMHGLQASQEEANKTSWFSWSSFSSGMKSLAVAVGIKFEGSNADDSAAKIKEKDTTLAEVCTKKVDTLLKNLENTQDKTLSALKDQLEAYQENLINYNDKVHRDSSLTGTYIDLAKKSFKARLVMPDDEYANLSRHIDLIKAATAINYVSEIGSQSYQWAQRTIFPKSVTTNVITVAGISLMASYLLKKIVFKSTPIFARTGIFLAGSACTLFCTQFYRQWNNEQKYRKELRTLTDRLAVKNDYLSTELRQVERDAQANVMSQQVNNLYDQHAKEARSNEQIDLEGAVEDEKTV